MKKCDDGLVLRSSVVVMVENEIDSETLLVKSHTGEALMRYRRFGRKNWQVSEIGYGMWGMGSWSGSDDEESLISLQHAVDLGCNFFDTAWAYGEGRSERLLGQLVRANPEKKLYTATKIPPKNRQWPSRREFSLDDSFPPDYIEEYVHKSLKNASLESFDLMQFHVWEDAWVEDDRWSKKTFELRSQGLIQAIGISLNRWEPWNGVRAVRSGLVDAVQVIYNIFDQNPEDELFPACRENDVAVIARVPFDEGTLTGTLTKESTWPEGDWRNIYFVPENLIPSVERADALKPLVPAGMTMPEMALRFILNNPTVSTIIPGMRKSGHVESNIAASDAGPLTEELHTHLREHRWERKPTKWSQ
jgi:aryl-alcohol dehydrogenase-like predicted oxidoreductase